MSWYLGVDGGGTKTRFALMDNDGQLLAQAQGGTTYHPEIGLQGVRRILEDGISSVLEQLGAADGQSITHAFFGLPAYGEDSTATALLDAMPRELLGHGRYRCDNDMVCGWAGSLACGDGINIVSGTGSIGYGQRSGMGARAGGWGEVFSDEGSAYWIAIQGLNAYSRMSDGRLAKGPLHALFNQVFQLRSDLDICTHVYGSGVGSRAQLAQYACHVAEAARLGDEAARQIYQQAGHELALIVGTLRDRLGFADGEAVKVSYSGGAFSAPALLPQFAAALQGLSDDFVLIKPLHEPHIGAALYARHLAINADHSH